MDYVGMDELLSIERNAREMDVYGIREEKTSQSFLKWISKKAVFITSVPFYWFIIFRYVIGSVEMDLFIFVVAASFAVSLFGNSGGWGLLNGLAA